MERNPNIQRSILDEIHLHETRYISVDEYKRILEEDYEMPEQNIEYRLLDIAMTLPEQRNKVMREHLVGLDISETGEICYNEYEAEMSLFTYEIVLN